ncbi:BTB/POZ domain-containing protein [Hirschfeldia incana]|nr:BTB/POZ domain-containing protein [Hirschfeldia incana]
MDSDSHRSFGFAFNSVHFPDCLLRIEITNGGEITNVDSVQDRKRRRTDANTSAVGGENEKECNPPAPGVTELHINSPILAAQSPFFYKLFSNGMIESEQKHVTLRIEASEEAAVMELLNFMHTNSLSSVTDVPDLLRVLMAAEKFEVASCMKYCTRLLLNIPMTLPYALFILRLPWSLILAASVKPLTNAARHFITMHYKDITMFPAEELMALPLVGIITLLMSNDLMIASEDNVYEIVLNWAKTNYSVLEERQGTFRRLARYVRFPYMTSQRLKKILTSDDFEPSVAYKLVLGALFFQAESSLSHRGKSLDRRFIERAYTYRPIKIVEFEVPHRQCIVYLDLTRKECNAMYRSNEIYSQKFHFGGQVFILLASCNKNQLYWFHHFGLYLVTQERGSASLTVDYEFSARWKPTQEFVKTRKGKYKFTGVESIGFRDLFGTSWASFIGEDSPYFINDVLHLRAELSIRP